MNELYDRYDNITAEQDEKRLKVKNCYISSPNLARILADIHRCRNMSKGSEYPECMLVLGEPGSGKTTLIREYLRLNPNREESERSIINVFSSEFPDKTVPREAAICFLQDLGHELSSRGLTEPELTRLLTNLMTHCGVQISLLDEFQHLIETKSYEVLEDVAKWIKILINRSNLPVVLFGMPYSNIILNCDDALAGRFMIQRKIEPFRIINKEQRQEFRAFLKVFNDSLPFSKKPGLHKLEFYSRLFAFSKGNMRRLRVLINYAAEEAILNQDDELNMEHFKAGYHYYMQNITEKDQIDSTEKIESQPNPFDVPVEELEFKQMESASYWKMDARKGEPRIAQAKYTRAVPLRSIEPLRSLLKRR
ncbi:TniB family NTP-binding protein [Endozoicomonas gorgoniicola]|uniref:TniB family NTP-binding protein n=1 Tax=Endozoicomonas gorgoniicola TaxID=1234144 RepID=A0ABT3N2R0_9GAMM|nr:TniB family NTP-binding protein [Endozoicomonas gorgoniicola]MCW7555917.1 TniB family NTP-binding protein [Endozoicomonas gorgoniicola]